MKAGEAEFARINAAVTLLHNRVQDELDSDGIARDQQSVTVVAECRYHGQGFELRATMPEGRLTADNVHVIADSFHDQHQQDYGYSYRKAEVELITLRAIGSAQVRRIEIPRIARTDGSSIDRALMFVRRTLETPRYDRTKLFAGDQVPGPSLLHQHNATTLVPPGYVAETLEFGNTRIRQIGA
jgi:N-methylhydantoinase A